MKSVGTLYKEVFRRLVAASGQSRAAKTVEVFGWLILLEGSVVLLFPAFAAAVLHLPTLDPQAENYFRLIGLLVSGIAMLYVASGRLNAEGFIVASLLDRPLVPFAMVVLWYLDIVPWPLALVFSLQDFGSFLWTLFIWRAENRAV
jgi:hypothetical protein